MHFLSKLSQKITKKINILTRTYAECGGPTIKGLVLGAYDCNDHMELSPTAQRFDDCLSGRLSELLKGDMINKGDAKVFSNLGNEYQGIVVAGLGIQSVESSDSSEGLNKSKETVRTAAGLGCRILQDQGMNLIMVEGFRNAEAAAEGATLGVWKYQDLKSKADRCPSTKVDLFEDPDREGWDRGMMKAEAQNIARKLEQTPSNLMTPSIFAQSALELLYPCGPQVYIRDRDWIETKKMCAFLGTSSGSCEPPLILEISYCGGNSEDKPVVMTGLGLTFDSGGLCLKDSKELPEAIGAMAGAAVCVGVMRAVSQLSLPVNINAVIPLSENMPGGMAVKPGDVVSGLNGKTMRIDSTQNIGKIILADVLAYSKHYDPCLVINVASLTKAVRLILGSGCSGFFTNSDLVWNEMKRAGADTGDRLWRFPLWEMVAKHVKDSKGVDVNDAGNTLVASAAFLREFSPPSVDFAHIDITGTGLEANGVGYPYLRTGLMTGRPTRTLTQFLYQMACPNEKCGECEQ